MLVYFFQTDRSVELGVFWVFVVIVLAGTLLVEAALVEQSTLFAIVGVLTVLLVVGRLALWACFDRRDDSRRAVARYNCFDVVAGTLVGATALAIFIGHNSPEFHGWWHVLAAVALYLIVESIYRR